ncbi:hypothetical protein CMV_010298 [Castanea mollissima]|uniref:Root UVB sensitive protein C-terminal domain-containing protein n=1 Tax=Castanea mollissima TaxID=60419 RepID=A0A8J4W0U9_9ROSI|nr:hypothetical protein CMV_010298 [Castanea mollissima]
MTGLSSASYKDQLEGASASQSLRYCFGNLSHYLPRPMVKNSQSVGSRQLIKNEDGFVSVWAARLAQPTVLSSKAKDAAAEIEHRLQLGSKLSDVVSKKEDLLALFDLYRNEGYILAEHKAIFYVVLKESSSPHDMLKALFHVNYLYWLEKNAGFEARSVSNDCRYGGRLQISLEYVQREFNHVRRDGESMGWVTDGLVARPLPTRIRLGHVASSIAS